MADTAETRVTPPSDRSLADERALDEKLAAAAARTGANAESRRVRGEGGTAKEVLARHPIIRSIPTGPAAAIRVPLEQGDGWTGGAAVSLAPDENYRASVVPGRFAAASFATFEPATRSQAIARDAVLQWLELVRAGESPMLALIGKQGAGKSHLLYAVANALLDGGMRCYARPWYKLADELRYGGVVPWAPKLRMEAHEVRELLVAQRVVLIDEVRPTAGTAFDDTELAKFACHAYDALVPVLITSNVSPLADVMGPPAASRFTQVIIDGPDRRQT